MPDPKETRDAASTASRGGNVGDTHTQAPITAACDAADSFAARLEELAVCTGSPGTNTAGDTTSTAEVSGRTGCHTIPRYEILGELGRGGMGVVYRARDTRLNREVALKMILGADTNRTALARFWAEAEVMAAVRHPHVVQVFELGEHDGSPFMAMELVSGGSLEQRLKTEGTLPPGDAVGLLEKIARGVAAAHELGIVHRDLKPGNVLLSADGAPRVTDFGIAKRATNELTATRAMMGTPAYMAPEQAAGRAKFVGPQADVWAIGVILYECLAGKRPFEGDSVAALLANIQSVEPVTLRTLVRSLPRDLETIASKCLAKEPEHRYPTAQELADDLRRFLQREPIAARPVGRAERLVRWVRRKPAAAAAYGGTTLAVLLTAVVVVIASLWYEAEAAKLTAESARTEEIRLRSIAETAQASESAARLQATQERDNANDARRREEAARREVEKQRELLASVNYGRTIQLAYQAWKDSKLGEARLLLAGTNPDLRGWEYHYVHRLCNSDLVTFKGHEAGVLVGVWNAQGTRVVTGGGDRTARVWDAESGAMLCILNHLINPVFGVSFTPDGSKVATVSPGTPLRLWEVETGKLIREFTGSSNQILIAGFSPDGSKLASAGDDGTAAIWDVGSGKILHELKGHKAAIRSVAFNHNGKTLATTSEDTTARLWDVGTGKTIHELKRHAHSVGKVSFSPDGARLATSAVDGTVVLWETATGRLLHELKSGSASLCSVSFNSTGEILLTTGGGVSILWDVATGQSVNWLPADAEGVFLAKFSPDGTKIVTSSAKSAKLWSGTGVFLEEFKGHTGYIRDMAFAPNSERVLTTSDDGTARVWDTTGANRNRVLQSPMSSIQVARFSPDGEHMVTRDHDDTARVWVVATGTLRHELKGHSGHIFSIEFDSGGKKLVTASIDGTARVWNIATGRLIHELKGHTQAVVTATFNSDDTKVVTAGHDRTARVWDVSTGKCLFQLTGHEGWIHTAQLDARGRRLITAGYDTTARVWDATTGELLHVLKGHGDWVGMARFSADGSKIITTSSDTTIRVWDAVGGNPLLVLRGHFGPILDASWSHDESRILTVGDRNYDGSIRLWDARSGAELLALHAGEASFSPDGTRLLLTEIPVIGRVGTASIHDSRPVNRAFIRSTVTPAPRER